MLSALTLYYHRLPHLLFSAKGYVTIFAFTIYLLVKFVALTDKIRFIYRCGAIATALCLVSVFTLAKPLRHNDFNKKSHNAYSWFGLQVDLLEHNFNFSDFFGFESGNYSHRLFLHGENPFSRLVDFFKQDPSSSFFVRRLTIKRIERFSELRSFPIKKTDNIAWLNDIKRYFNYFFYLDYSKNAQVKLYYTAAGYLDSIEVFDMHLGKYIKSGVFRFNYASKRDHFCVSWKEMYYAKDDVVVTVDCKLEFGKRQTFSFTCRRNNRSLSGTMADHQSNILYQYLKNGDNSFSYKRYDIDRKTLLDSIVLIDKPEPYKINHLQIDGRYADQIMSNVETKHAIQYIRYTQKKAKTIYREVIYLDGSNKELVGIDTKLVDEATNYYQSNATFRYNDSRGEKQYIFHGPCGYENNDGTDVLEIPHLNKWQMRIEATLTHGNIKESTTTTYTLHLHSDYNTAYDNSNYSIHQIILSTLNHAGQIDFWPENLKTSRLFHKYDNNSIGWLDVTDVNRRMENGNFYLFTL